MILGEKEAGGSVTTPPEQESSLIIDPGFKSVEPEKKKTAGEHYLDLLSKAPEEIDVVEMQREMQKDWEKNIVACVDSHKKIFPGDFYVVITTKRERILSTVVRNYFSARMSCPTPNYEQTVFKYHRDEDRLEFIWVVPDRETCVVYLNNAHEVDPKEYELLGMIRDFADGTLFRECKKRNGEGVEQ